jgi:hypothetical protein
LYRNELLFKKNRGKKEKKIKSKPPVHFLQHREPFSVWGDQMEKGDTK